MLLTLPMPHLRRRSITLLIRRTDIPDSDSAGEDLTGVAGQVPGLGDGAIDKVGEGIIMRGEVVGEVGVASINL
jgi:hypothetical protein